jgi:hypothetical protein
MMTIAVCTIWDYRHFRPSGRPDQWVLGPIPHTCTLTSVEMIPEAGVCWSVVGKNVEGLCLIT